MKQLTYADRELLLRTFDSLKETWSGADDDLLARAHEWAQSIAPTFGFEYALARDIAVLSRYLVDRKDDQDIAAIARGALLYILRGNDAHPAHFHSLGLLDDAFVCSYAVHEIRNRLGDPTQYTPPRLTPTEQKRAEDIFLKLLQKPLLDDAKLIAEAKRVADSLSQHAAGGIFQRLIRHIEYLAAVITDHRHTSEQCSFARAALAYIICEQDAIDDRLGIIGYLDDNFVAQLAVDLIEPTREPWLELLDATVAAWPFLNTLFIDDGSGVRLPSEFMIVNAALLCADVRARLHDTSAVLIAPSIGPIPFLLGVVAAIGLIQSTSRRNYSESDYYDGQKVLVDLCAIAEFAGFTECNGRKMFKLRQYRLERGERLATIRSWPISDLGRLIPVDATRATRGELAYNLSHADIPISGLEYLFGDASVAQLSAVTKRIVVVTPPTAAQHLARNWTIHGWALHDVIPMGHVTSNDNVRPWSTRFGNLAPLLIFAADLDTALAHIEEQPESYERVIIDATGRNAGKHASLRRLQQFRAPTLVITQDRDADTLDVTDSAVWEWTSDDLRALMWPSPRSQKNPGTIFRFEQTLRSQAFTQPVLNTLSLPAITTAFEAHQHVQHLAKQRGEDDLAELEDLLAMSFRIMSYLLRCATPIDQHLPSFHSLKQLLTGFNDLRSSSRYLSAEERIALKEFGDCAGLLFESLQAYNPKACRMQDLLRNRPAAIICPDARLIADLQSHYRDRASRIMAASPADSDFPYGVVVPGWFRTSRMANLLSPPVAPSLTLLLYDVEQQWYDGFTKQRSRARCRRRGGNSRSSLFPQFSGWKPPDTPPPAHTASERRLQDFTDLNERIYHSRTSRIYRDHRATAGDDTVPARLVLFVGSVYGFFTDTYKLSVVTHLIDTPLDEGDDRVSISLTYARNLRVGDAVVIPRSSRDAIRDIADTILPPGTRQRSLAWRRALLRFAHEYDLNAASLCERLHRAGCRVQQQAVQVWLRCDDIIAPQAYRRDVTAIAAATEDVELNQDLAAVLDAIAEVRSAHLRASHILANEVRRAATEVIRQEAADSAPVPFHNECVIVRVAEVASDTIDVRRGITNRLIEGDSWLE